jgi:hypothetical protein
MTATTVTPTPTVSAARDLAQSLRPSPAAPMVEHLNRLAALQIIIAGGPQ